MGINKFRWTYQLLLDVLSWHKNTLRELTIDQLGPQEGLAIFRITEFTKLEFLRICCSGRMPSPAAACEQWITPSLRTLCLSFSHHDSQNGVYYFMRDSNIEWIRDFLHYIGHKKQVQAVGLQVIDIPHYLDDYWYGEDEEDPYPGIFNTIKSLIESYGIEARVPQFKPRKNYRWEENTSNPDD